MKIIVKNDIYNISKRIKYINRDYYIVYNNIEKKFQIFDKQGVVITLPYKNLDIRGINFLVERLKKSNFEILEEVEKHNQKIDEEARRKTIEQSIDCAEKILRRS